MVEITSPNGIVKNVSRGTLGVWRRAGWVLTEDLPVGKNHLQDVGQSEEEESNSLSIDFDEEA